MHDAVVGSIVVKQFGDWETYLIIHPSSMLILAGISLFLFWLSRK